MLAGAGVPLERKGMALGFRVEHPQAHINRLSYGPELAWAVRTGKARTDDKLGRAGVDLLPSEKVAHRRRRALLTALLHRGYDKRSHFYLFDVTRVDGVRRFFTGQLKQKWKVK